MGCITLVLHSLADYVTFINSYDGKYNRYVVESFVYTVQVEYGEG